VFADLHHRANALAEEAEVALQRLRRQVEACFECDLALAVARVLQAQAEELERHRVQALATGLAAAPGTRVALDPPDLEFVLDNLVGNAIRAMTDTVERRLTLDASRSAGQVAVTVADTGCGMAPEDWEAVFDDRWSTRPGGGYGLARSRRELAVYGGSLRVVRSAPGQGTMLLLMLTVAQVDGPH
jgi:signal transduction histidine kinase